ncbi:unnamed protein product, partial [Acanthocheilonema viteae]
VSSYGIGSGPGGSGSWSTRGVGGISGDSYQQGSGIFGSHRQQTTFISAAIPTTLSQPIPRNVRRQLFKKLMLFVEPNPSSPKKLFELPKAPTYQTGGDYICQNEQYPITNLSDSNLSSNYYIENSRPSYSLRLPQKLFNELFLTCCQQHIPTNCHSLCTYEHCEHIAVEALIKAIQQDDCDLKYLNNTLYCGNRNRNNRNCWQFHEISLSELEVGNRLHFVKFEALLYIKSILILFSPIR